MRQRTSILVCLVLLLAACSQTLMDDKEFAVSETGTLLIGIDPVVQVETKTLADSDLPDVSDFTVEIYKYTDDGKLRLYRDSYDNTVNQKIKLNCADYLIHARCGDSLAVGFNSIYFSAEEDVTIRPQTDEVVNLEARMASVKVAVNYGENLKYDWEEYYSKIKVTTKGGRKRRLEFSKNETRAAYFPSGSFVVELYIKINGEWMYYHSAPMDLLPNDFVTFNVDVEKAESTLDVSARVERGETIIEKSMTLSSEMLPKDAPEIIMRDGNGVDFGNTTFSIVEANNSVRSDLVANLSVPGRIKNCWLEVTSEYLKKLGVPERIDLAAEMDPSVKETLESVGLKWMKGMGGNRLAYVDFSGITAWLDKKVYDSSNPFDASFSINVIDQRQAVEEAVSSPVKFTQVKPVFYFYSIDSYNCWAKRIEGITTSIQTGNPDKLVLEYKKSTDGDEAWTVMTPNSYSDTYRKSYDFTGKQPGTTYQFRARYNGNASTQIVRTATTEAAQQVGNAGFEEYTMMSFKSVGVTLIFFTKTYYVDWYQLYSSSSSDKWWAVNSTATLDSDITTEYINFKCFPTVNVTTLAYSGNYAVSVSSIGVADAASLVSKGDAKTGELYIGVADNSDQLKNAHLSNGHAFSSRPSSMSFYHKFDCHQSDPYSVEVYLYDSNGTQIARGLKNDAKSSVSSWTKVTIPISYTYIDRKAAKIYILFKSSATGSKEVRQYKNLSKVNSSGTETYLNGDGVYAGNILWLDQIELNY